VKFKLDENIPWILKSVIESVGQHVVDSVFHEGITGIDDKKLNRRCFEENRVLITLNSDFINPTDEFYVIIIIRSKKQGKNDVKELFERFLKSYSLSESIGKILIIEHNQIRVRF